MGRLAAATRRSSEQLRLAARVAKEMRGSVEAEQLRTSQAFLRRMSRRLPRAADLNGLLADINARWDPPDPEKGEPPTKGSKARDTPDANPRKELLRQTVLQFKRVHKLAKVLVDQSRKDAQTFAFIQQPARDMIRAPVPNDRFTADQMTEFLVFAQIFILCLERYARRLKS